MKRIRNYACFLLAGTILLAINSCSKKLNEHPYTVNTVQMFQNAQGIQLGINAVYSGLRWVYGPGSMNMVGDMGTDMWTYGDNTNTQAVQISNYSYDYTSGALQAMWSTLFNNINMCNGIITWAPSVSGIDTANILGQAHFLRGLGYLMLVSHFGAVPVDLGSGDLIFNESSFGGFNRLPTADILTKDWDVIISDFTYASQNLPDQRPAAAFTLSKAAALGMLAKAYIFKGYSANAESSDWQNAYNAAMQVINNKAQYGCALLQNYADVTAEGNDYNSEILFSVERLPGDLNDDEEDGGSNPATSGGKGVNAANDYNMSYDQVTAPTTSGNKPCATRTALYGRPMRVVCPTAYLYNTLFADKTNDSRYDGTFCSVYLATVATTATYPAGSPSAGQSFTYNVGDTAFVLAHSLAEYNALSAAQLAKAAPAKPYRVISPNDMNGISGNYVGSTTIIAPSMKKYWDSHRDNSNEAGGRPYPVIKLSEVYLLAAEADMHLGNTTEAASLINVLRTRAAYRTGLSSTDLAARVAAMQITASQVTLDFILDEHGRELAGEENRWPDLAMRGQLLNRVKLYNPPAATHIQDYMVLRPIPQSELNDLTVPNASQYQNPGWTN